METHSLSLLRSKSVVRIVDRLNMVLAVDKGVKPQTKQKPNSREQDKL